MKDLRILVVDDDPQNRKILKTILKYESELPAATASDGEMAINMMRGNQYDMIMTDLNMPKKNGLEVTEFIKRYFPAIKVILLTAFRGEIEEIQGCAVPPDRILRKPYSIQEIRDAIADLFPSKN